MRMILSPWPEVREALAETVYLEPGEHDLEPETWLSIVAHGFDVMVRHEDAGMPPTVYVSPGGRGFGPR